MYSFYIYTSTWPLLWLLSCPSIFKMYHCWHNHIFRSCFQCQEFFLNLPHYYSSTIITIFQTEKLIEDRSGDLGGHEILKSLCPPIPIYRLALDNRQLIIEPVPQYLSPMGRYKQIKGIINTCLAYLVLVGWTSDRLFCISFNWINNLQHVDSLIPLVFRMADGTTSLEPINLS